MILNEFKSRRRAPNPPPVAQLKNPGERGGVSPVPDMEQSRTSTSRKRKEQQKMRGEEKKVQGRWKPARQVARNANGKGRSVQKGGVIAGKGEKH